MKITMFALAFLFGATASWACDAHFSAAQGPAPGTLSSVVTTNCEHYEAPDMVVVVPSDDGKTSVLYLYLPHTTVKERNGFLSYFFNTPHRVKERDKVFLNLGPYTFGPPCLPSGAAARDRKVLWCVFPIWGLE